MIVKISGKDIERENENKEELIREHTIEVVNQPNMPENKKQKISYLKFNINHQETKSFLLTPNSQVKNDKVDLFVESFANNYKEMYQQFNQFKFDQTGISLPEQDKVFFEVLIKKEHYENFITTNQSQSEFVRQQIGFTWDCAVDEKTINTELRNVNVNHVLCIDFDFKYTSGLSLRVDGRTEEKPLREWLELMRMLKQDEMIFFQLGFQPAEPSWWKDADANVKNLPKRKHVSETSKLKLGLNGFDTCMRAIVVSPDMNRRIQLSRGFTLALKQMNGDQEIVEHKVKDKYLSKWMNQKLLPRKISVPFRFNQRMIMTWKEISNFVKLPKRNLQIDFSLDSVERMEMDIPKILQTKDGILIGESEIRGKKYEIKLPTNNLDHIMSTYVFTGSPRSGKDTASINMIVEGSKKGYGAFVPDVIDEKGNDRGMCDSIRDAIDPSKIIDLNFGDYHNPIYFGLEDVAEKIGVNGMNVIADSFIKVLGLENTTNAQELCSLVARACKCNIYQMYCFLKSRKYAEDIYNRLLENGEELIAMEVKYEYLKNPKSDQDAGAKALKTRLKVILGNPHFKNMISQEQNNKIDFEKWIREGKIVLLRMKKMDIGEVGVQILMYLLSMKIFWLKKVMNTNDCTYIVYNEPHQFMSDGLQELMESMMTEAPKYRLSTIWCFHNHHQLPSRLWEIMKSSSINWFLFKNTNHHFYRSISEQLEPITVEAAMATKQYESIYLPFIGGEQLTPFFMRMLKPPSMRQEMFDNSFLTEQHSKIYGRPVKDVQKKILQIETSMYDEQTE